MADIVDQQTRSRMMSRIRGRDTSPELRLRRLLHAMGLRFRLHGRLLPGRPDLVFPRYRAAVFVHGCFWHRHPGCRFATTPSSNEAFWREKFARTVARDAEVHDRLAAQGWRVAVVWECALGRQDAPATAEVLAHWLRGEAAAVELTGTGAGRVGPR